MSSEDIICRFIHSSDLHIGRFQYTNSKRAMDFINSFKSLLEDAYRNNVDFVLLAGDVFNSLDLLPYYFSQVVELLRKFQQKTLGATPIIAIEGNHDIRSFSKGNRISTNLSWLKVLSNLSLILLLDDCLDDPNRNTRPIQIKEARIYGNTYCGEKIDESLDFILKNIPRNNGFNILINHFGIEGQMKGIPGQPKYSLDKKVKPYIHYLATGHFHKQYSLEEYIYNPGCLSSACLSDFNLPHGYFLVEVRKNDGYDIQISKKRVRERKIMWKSLAIKSRYRSIQMLFSIIENFLKKEVPLNQLDSEPKSEILPVLCLTIRSSSGKVFSSAVKKQLRNLILQKFQVIECHLFQKQISYKSIEDFIQLEPISHPSCPNLRTHKFC